MIHYLQSSGIFGSLAILTGVFVAIASTLVLLIGRSRRAHKISVIAAGIPMIIGATGTVIGYLTTRDQMLDNSAMQDASVINTWHSELASCAIIGVAIALPLFIVLGVLFVYRSKHLQERSTH